MGVDAEMFVRTKSKLTDREVKRLGYEIAEAFGASKFFIAPKTAELSKEYRALSRVKVWEQDGPDIKPDPGETFLRVSLWTRYYGPGYERGDLPLIVAVAAWLELRVPGGRVWYGGDSSGVCAEPFGPVERTKMFAHFAKVGHRPYAGDALTGENQWSFLGGGVPAPKCEFCEVPMICNGGGGGGAVAFYHCPGCGKRIETRDAGVTWQEREKER